jgi:hypothetical protein
LDEDAAAEDSTVGKVPLRERLVHKDDASRSSAIAPLERTALHDGNPHRREVPATDEGTFGRQHARRIASLCVRFLPEPGRACHASKRQELDRSNRLNARQAFDAIEDLVQDSDAGWACGTALRADVPAWVDDVLVVCGIWSVLAPFVLAYSDMTMARNSDVSAGLIVAAVAGYRVVSASSGARRNVTA